MDYIYNHILSNRLIIGMAFSIFIRIQHLSITFQCLECYCSLEFKDDNSFIIKDDNVHETFTIEYWSKINDMKKEIKIYLEN
jgi:hypothetical protein